MDNRGNIVQMLFREGSELLQGGNAAAALERFRAAQRIDPSNATLHLYSGAAQHELGRYEEAVASYRHAIDIAPHMGEAHNNMGNALMVLGRFSDAADSFSRAVPLLASSPVPLTARATALQALGMVPEAEVHCRTALVIDPDFAASHWNLALNLLLQGRYAEGWPEYEWRWRKPNFTSPCRHTEVPLWDGSPLHGQTIVLHAEQGFGDTIQFVRYAPLVAERGGTVIVECHPQLVELLRSVKGIHDVVPFGAPLPPFNCQAPLLSLPRIFGTTLLNIPSTTPYVSVTAEQRHKWSSLMACHPKSLRAGLVWAGKSYPDPNRSCRLVELAPLATAQNITFFSLQLGAGSEQASSPPPGMSLIDLTDQIRDFEDTAALIDQLDLVISIDTAVAHLAGALGKPAFIMLPFAPDWRWLIDRCDSPWYPSMRLFRQEITGEWYPVISRIASDISRYFYQKKSPLETC
jgi:Tfp pilus assembly protein PilF